jgi:hypothetical protein
VFAVGIHTVPAGTELVYVAANLTGTFGASSGPWSVPVRDGALVLATLGWLWRQVPHQLTAERPRWGHWHF